jgi:hypothetical protein
MLWGLTMGQPSQSRFMADGYHHGDNTERRYLPKRWK